MFTGEWALLLRPFHSEKWPGDSDKRHRPYSFSAHPSRLELLSPPFFSQAAVGRPNPDLPKAHSRNRQPDVRNTAPATDIGRSRTLFPSFPDLTIHWPFEARPVIMPT